MKRITFFLIVAATFSVAAAAGTMSATKAIKANVAKATELRKHNLDAAVGENGDCIVTLTKGQTTTCDEQITYMNQRALDKKILGE